MGQIRVALRKDLSPASYGTAEVRELRGNTPTGDDVMLLAKRFMADDGPYYAATMVSAAEAEVLRRSFRQPEGINDRREISDKVKKNILNRVPRCLNQNSLSLEAAAYLTSWVDGSLAKVPRPLSHPVLTHRLWGVGVGERKEWIGPARERHIDLKVSHQADDSFSESDDGEPEGEIPLALEDAD